ncbi:MAG: glycosyltransferase family 2 protein [Bacteroidales bacterium]|nr:glycosyltransferase family 2 protein [Bacteroidales bacterium]
MNSTSEYTFTIIVPVYNEEDNIYTLEDRLKAYLPICTYRACVLFINDGSKDNSGKLLAEICSRNKDFFYISFTRNAGLSAALKAGIDCTESEYVGYMDADLQTAPEDFNLLLADIAGYSMVIGIRASRKDSFFKNLQSRIANGFRRMMTGDGATDTGCPLKVLHTDVAKRIPLFKGMHRFLPALVLLQEGATYRQIPVRHFPRVAGVSKYHLWNRLWGPFADCFAYRWMKPRYINYSIAESNITEPKTEAYTK